ncbi:unnamed protein product [Lactuca virosa]|uniref:Uncharacterized protein n=1 Tax=Lactuca virosa TaxID=75947 RepID=A0AAU9P1B7_9ASTR|nr:unnamed protein product [Lactuca virosa]
MVVRHIPTRQDLNPREHDSPFGVATVTGANKSEPAAADGAGGGGLFVTGNNRDCQLTRFLTAHRTNVGLAIFDFAGSNQRHSKGSSRSDSGDEQHADI